LTIIEYDEFGRAESYSCSGMLIADSGRTGAPYLLTADHCIGNRALAFDADAYLFWRTTVCSMDIQDPRLALFAWGLDYLYSENERTGADMTLLRPANNSYHVPEDGLRLAGWSAATQVGTQPVMGFHHPNGDHLMRSLGFASPSPKRNYLRVVWNEGTTERGSSGSALLNAQNEVIGTLWGGASSCDARSLPDDYGRFSVAYSKGLRNWLNTPSRPLAMVARMGHDVGSSELIFSDLRASPSGRTAYQAARLNSNVDGLASGNPWRMPPALAALESGVARIVAVQDVDGDGRDDVVLRRPGAFGTEFFSVLQEREADGVTTSGQWLLHERVAPSTTVLGIADFDGNGMADLVLYNPRSKLIQVVFLSRDGSGNYVTRLAELFGLVDENQRPIASLSPVAVGDFNGTGQAQILLQDRRVPRLALFAHWNNATGWFEEVGTGQMALSGTLVATPDVNGDGRTDFIFNARGIIRYALSQGGGLPGNDSYVMQAQQTVLPALPTGFVVAAVKDANGDGLVDLVLRNSRTGEVRVARNTGSSTPWPVSSINLQ
jgi:hypothetical protein